MTRRDFLQIAGAAPLLLPEPATLDPGKLEPFVDSLPIPPLARPNGARADPRNSGVQIPYYRIAMRQIRSKVHRDLPPTQFWSYGSTVPGPTFEARTGKPLMIEWANELPLKHFLPIDHTIEGAEPDKPDVRAIVHLHGGRVPPQSDGYPENWFVPGKSVISRYPNCQDAAMLWYHDHAMGINRLNIYAGLFGAFFLRDPIEASLNLPRGQYEIPLIIFDRIFRTGGELFYPVSPDPKSPWVPEVFGNAILVNGKLFPHLDVEPRRYRFRMLNASNGRFYYFSLSNGRTFYQIGTDQGLLPAPLPVKGLALAPGERADLLIDFRGQNGRNIVLKSDAYTVMQFRVASAGTRDTSSFPATLRPGPTMAEAEASRTRLLRLGEVDDPEMYPIRMLLNQTRWSAPVTENPVLGSVEIWSFVNVTDDSHPIHLHLVRFQILHRRPFDLFTYLNTGRVRYTGPPIPPEPNEAGWKDTVRADPAMVTRIIVKFEGFSGRYVWHCHILEHEDNEMMRPYDVVAAIEPRT
jgi:spore coat protein A